MIGVAPHVLVDLQSSALAPERVEEVIRSFADAEESSPFGRVRLLLRKEDHALVSSELPSSWDVALDEDPVSVANLSMRAASEAGAPMLFSIGAAAPTEPSLRAMQLVQGRDPYFAFVRPRFSELGREYVAKLDPRCGDPTVSELPINAIRSLRELYIVADQLASSLLVSARVIRDFERLDETYCSIWAGLRDLMGRARRVGFRCVVANRALVDGPDEFSAELADPSDLSAIYERYPEVSDLDEEWKASSIHDYESLLGRVHASSSEMRKTLLIDLTDLNAAHNGTSEAVVGILWGFKVCRKDWNISLLVSPEVADFHQLGDCFSEFELVRSQPTGRYTAVFRPIQPWSLTQLERLHHLGLFNFVMIFDTIANEIRIGSPHGLDKVWERLAKSADGLVYISRFTRDRFRIRFPVDESVDECVSHLSLNPGDYCERPSGRGGEFIFVVGNDYPHKWMEQTVSDLVGAFPYQRFKALGYDAPEIPQLTSVGSGSASHLEVEELFANARVVVYPSQYEGFGFPVIRALSHGKTVIARASALLSEQAALYRGPGRILPFETRAELVELVARELHGLEVDPMPLGMELAPNAGPVSQVAVSTRILEFIEDRTAKANSNNWARRQAFFDGARLYSETR